MEILSAAVLAGSPYFQDKQLLRKLPAHFITKFEPNTEQTFGDLLCTTVKSSFHCDSVCMSLCYCVVWLYLYLLCVLCICPFMCVCVCQVIVHEVPGQELEVEVFDKDPDQDDFLGR